MLHIQVGSCFSALPCTVTKNALQHLLASGPQDRLHKKERLSLNSRYLGFRLLCCTKASDYEYKQPGHGNVENVVAGLTGAPLAAVSVYFAGCNQLAVVFASFHMHLSPLLDNAKVQ